MFSHCSPLLNTPVILFIYEQKCDFLQTFWNNFYAEWRQSGVSDISEQGVDQEQEMLNPERSDY